MAIVYVLINEAMPGMVKIGISDNTVEKRMNELYTSGVPLPFECFYAVDIGDDKEKAGRIERMAHAGLNDCRIHKRKEFFRTTPKAAKSILSIAEEMGGKDVTPSDDIVENQEDQDALDKARARNLKLSMIGIGPGTILYFKGDENITCETLNDTQVKFEKEVTTLSASALKVLKNKGKDWRSARGGDFWCYGESTLTDLRAEKELEQD